MEVLAGGRQEEIGDDFSVDAVFYPLISQHINKLHIFKN